MPSNSYRESRVGLQKRFYVRLNSLLDGLIGSVESLVNQSTYFR